jgi:hypothetical protein
MTRSCLLNRQAHEIVEFEFRGLAYTVGVGRFADGSLVEARSNDGLPQGCSGGRLEARCAGATPASKFVNFDEGAPAKF